MESVCKITEGQAAAIIGIIQANLHTVFVDGETKALEGFTASLVSKHSGRIISFPEHRQQFRIDGGNIVKLKADW
jgi:hypothetical protein